MEVREDIINELHKPARRNYPQRKMVVLGILHLVQIDLVEMDSGNLKGISKINNGFKYILTAINVFSKYAFAVPLKSKSSLSILNGLKIILKEFYELYKSFPKNIQSDRERGIYSKEVQAFFKSNNINHYSTSSKAWVVERLNRTLKEKMWKKFTLQGNFKWLSILPKLLEVYNNEKHSTIKMKPIEVNEKNESLIFEEVFKPKSPESNPKFKVGDVVRISKEKGIFEKGYTPNWTTELFTISEVFINNPPYYHIKDMGDEEIKGTFYEQELMKTKYPQDYLIEKIIRKKGNKVYVKWLGLNSTHNQWITKDSLL